MNNSYPMQSSTKNEDTSGFRLEIVIREYEYERSRRQKLETKAGITIAFMGVLVPYIVEYFNFITIFQHSFCTNLLFLGFMQFFTLLCWLAIIITYSNSMYQLIKVLNPVDLNHISPEMLNTNNVASMDRQLLNEILINSYTKCSEHNSKLNNKQAEGFSEALKWIIKFFIFIVSYELLSNLTLLFCHLFNCF